MHAEKLSVCHIASGDRWAGAEVQIAALLRELNRRKDLSVSAILLNEGQLAAELRSAGVEVKIIREAGAGFFRIVCESGKYIRGKSVHILHSHRYKENLLATVLKWRWHILWVVRTQHGAPEPFKGWRKFKHALAQRVDRLTARYFTDCVISVSSEMRKHLTRHVDDARVVMIPNGMELERVGSSYSIAEAKSRLGIPAHLRVMGTAGRLERVKRLDILLAAATKMAALAPELRFVIAGTGSEEAALRKLAKDANLGEKVLFLGHRNDIYDVLRAMDIFMLTSDHEGMPMVLLEALWLGVPVVARAVGGIPEVIENGVSGVLIDSDDSSALADAGLALLHDESRRERFGREGSKRVGEKFTAARTAGEVARLYASLGEVK